MVDDIQRPTSVYSKVKLRKISTTKLAVIFSFFGLINGIISGFLFFLFFQLSVIALEIEVPLFGMILFSFLIVPLVVSLISAVLGLVFGFVLNLSLKISKGWEMFFEEQN